MPGNQRGMGGGPGRPMKPRRMRHRSGPGVFAPGEGGGDEPILIRPDEVEAIRLVDYLGQSQEEAAESMGVSRGTVWRLVDGGRRKLSTMLVEGRPLKVQWSGEDASGDTF